MAVVSPPAPAAQPRGPRPPDAPRRRFVVGIALLVAAGVMAVLASWLPWMTTSDMPSVGRSGWDLFDAFGVRAAPTFPGETVTGPVVLVAGIALLVVAMLLVVRRRVSTGRLPLVVGAGLLGVAAAVALASVAGNVVDMAQPSCGCAPPSPADVVVHWRYGAILVGLAAVPAVVGFLLAVVPSAIWARRSEPTRRPLGW